MHCTYYLSRNCYILQVLVQLRRLTLNILVKTRNKLPGVPVAKQLPCHTAAAESRNRFLQLHHEDDKANFKHFMFHYLLFEPATNKDNIYWSLYPKRPCKFSTNFWWTGPIQWESNGRKRSDAKWSCVQMECYVTHLAGIWLIFDYNPLCRIAACFDSFFGVSMPACVHEAVGRGLAIRACFSQKRSQKDQAAIRHYRL